jgi:hypothetical protein
MPNIPCPLNRESIVESGETGFFAGFLWVRFSISAVHKRKTRRIG